MKVVAQRSLASSVSINGNTIGSIDNGLTLLIGFTEGDTSEDIDYIIKKIVNLRIFDDEKGVMNKSILDIGGSVLSISQFTLYADPYKGNRPSYINALNRDKAVILYNEFNEKLSKIVNVQTGRFGADMKVNIINDGPVTIIIDTNEK